MYTRQDIETLLDRGSYRGKVSTIDSWGTIYLQIMGIPPIEYVKNDTPVTKNGIMGGNGVAITYSWIRSHTMEELTQTLLPYEDYWNTMEVPYLPVKIGSISEDGENILRTVYKVEKESYSLFLDKEDVDLIIRDRHNLHRFYVSAQVRLDKLMPHRPLCKIILDGELLGYCYGEWTTRMKGSLSQVLEGETNTIFW